MIKIKILMVTKKIANHTKRLGGQKILENFYESWKRKML
jgi:hypothetical protein